MYSVKMTRKNGERAAVAYLKPSCWYWKRVNYIMITRHSALCSTVLRRIHLPSCSSSSV